MQRLEYRVKFITPAFLGNAEQNGQWRTPPFKALLRQWWRVAYAAEHGFDVTLEEMRRAEGCLFGVAADVRGGSRRSEVRIRLDRWSEGALTKAKWGKQELNRSAEGVTHPEVGQIGAKLYLGYGPLVVEKVPNPRGRSDYATVLKKNAAIQQGDEVRFSIAYPDSEARLIERALVLIHQFGTLGGRSRNGWGSLSLTADDESTPTPDAALDPSLIRSWHDALGLDWPHAIGRDDSGPLVWQTEPFGDWEALMRRLAEIKIGLRTQFRFTTGNNAPAPEDRHWLSYPVTKHSVRDWRNARLPNSLRFKARPNPDGGVYGAIFHVPCLPRAQFHPDRRAIERVWQRVHAFLDDPAQKLSRSPV